jgi:predicted PurR-regulated permease PerM
MANEHVLEISWGTIAKIFVAIFALYFIYLSKEIALWLFSAVAVSILLDPAVYFLKRWHIPKIIAVFLVYISIFGVLGLLIYITAPLFVSEIRQFLQYLPGYFEQISPILKQFGVDTAQNFDGFTSVLSDNLQQSSQSIIKALMVFFGGLAATVSILTMAFFLSLEEGAVEKVLLLVCPPRYEEQIKNIFERVQSKVAGWFAARLIACIFIAIGSYVVFYIFGVKYALLLALISGFLNFIPYIGPWITSILLITIIAVSTGSWTMVMYVLVAVTLVQEIENKLLTPLLMKKMTDIPPVLVLVSLLIGAKIFGFLGIIFAVPIFGIIYEFIKEFLEKRKQDALESQ